MPSASNYSVLLSKAHVGQQHTASWVVSQKEKKATQVTAGRDWVAERQSFCHIVPLHILVMLVEETCKRFWL